MCYSWTFCSAHCTVYRSTLCTSPAHISTHSEYFLLQADLRDLYETLIKNAASVLPQPIVIEKLKVECSASDLQAGVQESVISALGKLNMIQTTAVYIWLVLIKRAGGLHQDFLKIKFLVVSDREEWYLWETFYQIKNIALSLKYRFFWKSNWKIYLLLQFLSNYPETFRICSRDHLETICFEFSFRPLIKMKCIDLKNFRSQKIVKKGILIF